MHLIFDLDGTLIDSRPGIHAALEVAIHSVYPHLDINRLDISIGPQIGEILRTAIKQASASEMAAMETAFRTAYDGEEWQKALIYPGVEQTLEELLKRGNILYIFTNKPKLPTSKILNCFELAEHFRDAISSDSRQPKFSNKTDILNYLMQKHTIPCSDAVCIGDSEDDFLASQSCNVAFLGIEYGYGTLPFKESPLKSLKTFPDILLAL